jgi:DNA polymerase
MITRFNVCDLNAIETRVGAWLAECPALLDVFTPLPGLPNGKDPYIDFACKIYGKVYDKLYADLKSKDKVIKAAAKLMRQMAKPGVLGAIYRLGPGGWGRGKSSYIDPATGEKVWDRVRTGLWGYAWNMGIEMTQEQSEMVVRMFREAYPEICGTGKGGTPKGIWYRLEEAIADVMDPEHPCTMRYIGPGGCVLIDKLNLKDRHPLMRMRLPSGRRLHYLDAHLRNTKMPWQQADADGNFQDVYRPALWYANADQVTGQWSTTTTHGGKEFENLVQGIARDVLAVKLLEFEENDMPVVGHFHDEGLCLVPDDPFSPGVDKMVEIMSKPIPWAPGLLLGADGFEGGFYHK